MKRFMKYYKGNIVKNSIILVSIIIMLTSCASLGIGTSTSTTTTSTTSPKTQATVVFEEVGSNLGMIHDQWKSLLQQGIINADQNVQFNNGYKIAYDAYKKAGELLKLANSSTTPQNQSDYSNAIKIAGDAFRQLTIMVLLITTSK